MTKKMEKMVNSLRDKMDTYTYLYEIKVIDFKKAMNNIYDERDEFDNMISSMFHFGVISENDFTETQFTASNLADEYLNKLHDISWKIA